MQFEWDHWKDTKNQAKHGVCFKTAALVFNDPLAKSVQDREVDSEERWQTIGLVNGVHLLLVAHTSRDEEGEEIVRIISARKVTPQERDFYEE